MARVKRSRQVIAPEAFPHVVAFLRGYLHEDWALDHASAAEARDAFLDECTPEERRAFRRESARLARALSGVSLAESRRLITEVLGSAWRPATRLEVDDLFAAADDRP